MVAPVDPERLQTLANYTLKIKGSPAPKAIDQAIAKIVVDERVNAPGMVEVHFLVDQYKLELLDEPSLREGVEIEITAGRKSQEESIGVATISSIEIDLDDQRPMLVVRGYDKSFKMHRDVKHRSFVQESDSDIARKFAQEAGLTANVDATDVVHEYILQYAQTNHEFLSERARRIGYEYYVNGRELRFHKRRNSGPVVSLEWGKSMKRFSPRLSVAEQVNSVEVRGWDPKEKQAVISKVTDGRTAPKTGVTTTGPSNGEAVWGSARQLIPNATVKSENDAKLIAQGEMNDRVASYIEATGECIGDPKLRVGATVKIDGVGNRFKGEYFLTAVRHTLTKQEGYHVGFTASTRQASTVSTMLTESKHPARVPYFIVGIVTNNQDPDKLGKIKVKYPTLSDEEESCWARLVTPFGGADRGFYCLPEVNDEVIVAFEGGDPSNPYVMGSLWNGRDKPPTGNAEVVASDGKVNQRIWRSRTGHIINFDDTEGSESIQIIDKTGKNHIIITSHDNKMDVWLEGDITVNSKTGEISMTAEKDIVIQSRNGKISMTAKQDASMKSETGMVQLTAQTDALFESKTAKAGISGVTTELKASTSGSFKTGTDLKVEAGTELTASGTAKVEVSAGGPAKLAGAVVDVQAQGITNIKGALVNIN